MASDMTGDRAFEIDGLMYRFPTDKGYEKVSMDTHLDSFQAEFENGTVEVTPELYIIAGMLAPNDERRPEDDLEMMGEMEQYDNIPIDPTAQALLNSAIKNPGTKYVAWENSLLIARIVMTNFTGSDNMKHRKFYLFHKSKDSGYKFMTLLDSTFTVSNLLNIGRRQLLLTEVGANVVSFVYAILQTTAKPIRDTRFGIGRGFGDSYSGLYRIMN